MSNVGFEIWWKGECVDETETEEDANYLLREYNMAFFGGCSIVKR